MDFVHLINRTAPSWVAWRRRWDKQPLDSTRLQQLRLLGSLTRAGKSSQYGDKMILRVIKDFFYLSNLWTRFEGVDNLTAFDSVMLKRSFSHGGAYLSLNCCKKNKKLTHSKKKPTKKRMSGIVRTFISAFYFLSRHFQLYFAIITSPSW